MIEVFIKFAKSLTDQPYVVERLEICKKCEFFDQEKMSCSQCGCYMQIKSRMPDATCPLGKW